MKLANIQTLSEALRKAVQEKVARILEKEVANFYHNNAARFERAAELDRIYIPKTRQTVCDNNLNREERQRCSEESEQTMKKGSDILRTHAISGEEFPALQVDAYRAAGIRTAVPGTSIQVRRISLPPDEIGDEFSSERSFTSSCRPKRVCC
jgi:hypothetical protein